MSIVGILGSNLFSGVVNRFQGTQGAAPKFERIGTISATGQDLQSGNLTQAQTDTRHYRKNFRAKIKPVLLLPQRQLPQPRQLRPLLPALHRPPLARPLPGRLRRRSNLPSWGKTCSQATCRQHSRTTQICSRQRNKRCATSRRSSQRTSPSWGRFAICVLHFLFFPAIKPHCAGIQFAGAGFAGGESFGSTVGICDLQNDLQQIGGFASPGSGGTRPTSTGAGSSTGGNLNVSA